jgi:hypothetical protein
MMSDCPLPAPTASLPPNNVATKVPKEEKTLGAGAAVVGPGVMSSRMGIRVVPIGPGADDVVAAVAFAGAVVVSM